MIFPSTSTWNAIGALISSLNIIFPLTLPLIVNGAATTPWIIKLPLTNWLITVGVFPSLTTTSSQPWWWLLLLDLDLDFLGLETDFGFICLIIDFLCDFDRLEWFLFLTNSPD